MNKRYVGIKFHGGKWEIVPAVWMSDSNSRCYWPNFGNVKELAAKCSAPDITWGSYVVKEICITSGE